MAAYSVGVSLRRTWRLFDYWASVFRRTWRGGAISSFVTPLLYILSLGVILGRFVHTSPAQMDGAGTYLQFVAPGMVASQAMTGMFGEFTYGAFGRIQWDKSYFSMMATPLTVAEIALGHVLFALFRTLLSCGVFFVVMSPFHAFRSVGGVLLALVVQLLIALAFATPLFAIAATVRTENVFNLVFRLAMTPLFLFSGGFFPITNLPGWLQWIARVTPLWHGVDLTRMLVLGHVDAARALVHVAYLVALTLAGWWLLVRQLTRRMVT